ncbi:MAG TPA: hypothetical protein VFI42_14860 [Thermomicrobiaceae bacterium]|nr:hypothetical protein [Thermomicrobiaceae bacterium]
MLLGLALVGLMLNGLAGTTLASAPPPHLDDNTGLTSTVSLAGDVCQALLDATRVPLIGDIACPGMSGRVIEHPHIHNIFAGDDWDNTVPAPFSQNAINQMTQQFVGTDYLSAAAQYHVSNASFAGSTANNGCFGAPNGDTNPLAIELWITCEVEFPGTDIPYPDDNTLYVMYLPPTVDITTPAGTTCNNVGAYHLQSMAVNPWPIPHFQSYAYIVVPLKCAGGTKDGWSKLFSHEFIEAVTDPIVPHGWIDNSTFSLSEPTQFATAGEASDICSNEGAVPTDAVRLDNGMLVAPYWSNQDSACVPLTHTLTLTTLGLPGAGEATLTCPACTCPQNSKPLICPDWFGDNSPHSVDLAKLNRFLITDGSSASWTFQSIVPGSPGVRFVTDSLGSNGPVAITSNRTSTAVYTQQDLLAVHTLPPQLVLSDATLTVSQWVPDGSTVSLATDAIIPADVDRYRFDQWTGDLSSNTPTTSILMDGPKTATAEYVLQHHVTFAQSGIPDGVPWSVTVNGALHLGPYDEWFDAGSSVPFSYQDPVPDLSPGTRYPLVGASATTPLDVTATGTVTAFYKTQHLLTVNTSGLPAPNFATITNGGVTLGSADDTTPVSVWLDDGTTLTLAGAAVVNGIDGTQYFAQSFTPAPPATLATPVTTTLTYQTMSQLVANALAGGGISGAGANGVANALTQQFAAVQSDMQAHRYAPALGSVTAFLNLVEAQRGQHISPNTATTLQLDALLVYHSALCSGAGQLSADQLNHDYAYYVEQVMRLGGSVLPACG